LRKEAADALVMAHRAAAKDGFGLTIFDGYRPFRISQLMWDVTPRKHRNYVANPKQGSRHNRGCAVDLTLHDLKTGLSVEMPSAYDEFTKRAHLDFTDAPAAALHHRTYLVDVMQAHGFYAMANEWWHFDFRDWKQFPLLDVPFEVL
jgi:D-alanyl-D-alanine dipeptidase